MKMHGETVKPGAMFSLKGLPNSKSSCNTTKFARHGSVMSALDYHTKHTASHLTGKDQQTGLAMGAVRLAPTFHSDRSAAKFSPNESLTELRVICATGK
jgi:hypothetical protein